MPIKELEEFYGRYNGEKGVLGKSFLGRDIYYFAAEKSDYPVIICQYAMHAREYITTYIALKHIEWFLNSGKRGKAYFIPAVNPDGIEIALTENPLYKANANGVDLNVNFDAGWGEGVFNKKIAGDANFIGEYPFSEVESRALRDFTLKVKPAATLSFHSKGREIYYGYKDGYKKRDRSIAEALGKITGYAVKTTPYSSGGYKDWCVKVLNIPAFTLEVGSDNLSHPIKKDMAEEIFTEVKDAVNLLTELL